MAASDRPDFKVVVATDTIERISNAASSSPASTAGLPASADLIEKVLAGPPAGLGPIDTTRAHALFSRLASYIWLVERRTPARVPSPAGPVPHHAAIG